MSDTTALKVDWKTERQRTVSAVLDVMGERRRQQKKHGPQLFVDDDYRLTFTLEEFGEVGKALYEIKNAEQNKQDTTALYDHLYEEITQTAACLVAWLEYLRRMEKVYR
ncbi:MAG: hypothetical protein U0641_05640 [Anaerolineae bacterium]